MSRNLWVRSAKLVLKQKVARHIQAEMVEEIRELGELMRIHWGTAEFPRTQFGNPCAWIMVRCEVSQQFQRKKNCYFTDLETRSEARAHDWGERQLQNAITILIYYKHNFRGGRT